MERNLLIVSRDNFLREMVRLALRDLPVAIHSASDAASAAALSVRLRPDCTLLLGAAPLLGGGREAEALRACRCGGSKLLVVAWQHAEQTVLGLLENGVDQYMAFPVNLRRLRSKVASLTGCRV